MRRTRNKKTKKPKRKGAKKQQNNKITTGQKRDRSQ